MAYMIPETLPRNAKVTAGERLLFGTLREHLPDDYIVYYEPRIFGRCPDFVVIGCSIGSRLSRQSQIPVRLWPRVHSDAGDACRQA